MKLLLETEKKLLINKIKLLFKSKSEAIDFEVLDSQKKELDKRLERLEKGETKFYSWEQVEEKLKKAL